MTREISSTAAGHAQKNNAVLEIRLPDTVKTDFAARCRADGVSVSEAVRGLIDAHMTAAPRAGAADAIRRLFMTKIIRRLGAGLGAAAAAGALGLAVLSPMTASADDLGLTFQLALEELVQVGAEREIVSRRISSTLNLDYGAPAVFTLPAATEAGGLRSYEVTVTASSCAQNAIPECAERNVIVDFSVMLTGGGEPREIARPRLIVRSGEHASLRAVMGESSFIEVDVEAHPLDGA